MAVAVAVVVHVRHVAPVHRHRQRHEPLPLVGHGHQLRGDVPQHQPPVVLVDQVVVGRPQRLAQQVPQLLGVVLRHLQVREAQRDHVRVLRRRRRAAVQQRAQRRRRRVPPLQLERAQPHPHRRPAALVLQLHHGPHRQVIKRLHPLVRLPRLQLRALDRVLLVHPHPVKPPQLQVEVVVAAVVARVGLHVPLRRVALLGPVPPKVRRG